MKCDEKFRQLCVKELFEKCLMNIIFINELGCRTFFYARWYFYYATDVESCRGGEISCFFPQC